MKTVIAGALEECVRVAGVINFLRQVDAVIRLACIIHGADYWRRGRTIDKLGVERWSVSQLIRFVNDGTCD